MNRYNVVLKYDGTKTNELLIAILVCRESYGNYRYSNQRNRNTWKTYKISAKESSTVHFEFNEKS